MEAVVMRYHDRRGERKKHYDAQVKLSVSGLITS
jgi:hypothetical protein